MTEQNKDQRLKFAAGVGCASAVAAGVLADVGMNFTSIACAFITACCFVYCGAEWDTK